MFFTYIGNHKRAKTSFSVGLLITAIWVLLFATLLISLKDYIPLLFSSDQCILKGLNIQLYIAALCIIFEHLSLYLQFVVIGMGKQFYGSIACLFSYALVGVPTALILVFVKNLGALGYWIGLFAANIVETGLYLIYVLCLDWRKVAFEAQKRAQVLPTPLVSLTSNNEVNLADLDTSSTSLLNETTKANSSINESPSSSINESASVSINESTISSKNELEGGGISQQSESNSLENLSNGEEFNGDMDPNQETSVAFIQQNQKLSVRTALLRGIVFLGMAVYLTIMWIVSVSYTYPSTGTCVSSILNSTTNGTASIFNETDGQCNV